MDSTLAATLVLIAAAVVLVLLLGFGTYTAYRLGDGPKTR